MHLSRMPRIPIAFLATTVTLVTAVCSVTNFWLTAHPRFSLYVPQPEPVVDINKPRLSFNTVASTIVKSVMTTGIRSEVRVNPILDLYSTPQVDVPRYSDIKASDVEPAALSIIEKRDAARIQLESEASSFTTAEGLLERMQWLEDDYEIRWGSILHLQSVCNSDELRQAIEKVEPLIVECNMRMAQSKVIYDALKALKSTAVDPIMERMLTETLKDFELGGVALEGKEKERYQEVLKDLQRLSTKYNNNTVDSVKAFSREVTDGSLLTGVPASAREGYAMEARKRGSEEANADSGPWVITLDHPSVLPILQYSENRDFREEIYRANATKGGVGTPTDNTENVKNILKLRKELAAILGFSSFGVKQFEKKMATPESAMDLVESQLTKSLPLCDIEYKDLSNYAFSEDLIGPLQLWDESFYSERLRKSRYEFDEEALKDYFSFSNSLEGLVDLIQRLFGVTLRRLEDNESDMPVWHEDCVRFAIDDGGVAIAYIIVDPYVRPGEKRSGAWMNEICSRGKMADGRMRLPVAVVVCNQAKPTQSRPSLMSIRDVETLFHEFGHALQHVLTKVDSLTCSGIRMVSWDAVEVPSQFMENWLGHYPIVSGFAKHYITGEPIPAELVNKLKTIRQYRAGSHYCRQMHFAMLDLLLHSTFDPEGKTTANDLHRELQKRTHSIPRLEEDTFLNNFGHIFGGGYASGYYSYLWAEVMSADGFAAFEEAGLENDEEVERLGRLWRDSILAKGGSVPPALVFDLFRGRAPNNAALLRHNGIEPAGQCAKDSLIALK